MAVKVIIDGSNLCTLNQRGAAKADFERLERLISQIVEQGDGLIEYRVFVDASLRHKLSDEHNRRLDEALRRGDITQAPANIPADDFILAWADRNDAIVVSNDTFNKYHANYPWIRLRRSGRCVTGDYDADQSAWTLLERNPGDQPARSFSQLVRDADALVPSPSLPPPTGDENAESGSRKYTQRITSARPQAIVLLLDQSGSMRFPWGSTTRSHRLASIVDQTLYTLVLSASQGERIKPYFDVAIIGYGGDAASGVRSLAPNSSLDSPFCSIDQIALAASVVEVDVNGVMQQRPKWLDPRAGGETPMAEALEVAHAAVTSHVARHPDSFPPVVINVTDGEAEKGDPVGVASRIKSISTSDGASLILAAHIGGETKSQYAYPVERPDDAPKDMLVMFDMASVLPETMRKRGLEAGIQIPEGGRACLYNASPEDLVKMLNLGTLPEP